MPNLYSVQIQQSVKFDHCSNLARCQNCAINLGYEPNFFYKVNANVCKFVHTNLALCLLCLYNVGMLPNFSTQIYKLPKIAIIFDELSNFATFQFECSNLAMCLVCSGFKLRRVFNLIIFKFGKVQNLCTQFRQGAKFVHTIQAMCQI